MISRKEIILKVIKVSEEISKNLSVYELEKFILYIRDSYNYLKLNKELDSFRVTEFWAKESMKKVIEGMKNFSYRDQLYFIDSLLKELRYQRSIRE